jgi:hypothetical protein
VRVANEIWRRDEHYAPTGMVRSLTKELSPALTRAQLDGLTECS